MFNEYADLRHIEPCWRDWEVPNTGHGEQAEIEARSLSAESEGVIFPGEVKELH